MTTNLTNLTAGRKLVVVVALVVFFPVALPVLGLWFAMKGM